MPKKLLIKSYKQIKGLYYIDNINIDLSNITNQLDEKKWINVSKNIKSRKVQHYGYKYDYIRRNIFQKTDDIPEFLYPVKKKLVKICKYLKLISDDYDFNQCIVNNYIGKQGIGKHIDLVSFGNVIGCITIGSGAIMRFRFNGEKKDIYVKPNSLYIMSGDARYKWTHEMPSNLYDTINGEKIKRNRRISITFRNVPNNK